MKHYPSIPKFDIEKCPDIYYYCFQKIDGSNISAEWNIKRGFYKFGTRNELIDENSKPFGRAIKVIKDKFEEDISLICREHKWRDALFFFEFYGPSSCFGTHNFEEDMTATLIDVNPYKEGIMPPTEFIKYFGHLDIAKVLYEGHITADFVDSVKKSSLKGMSEEGVVCKGCNDKKTKMPVMFKIKSKKWLDKLKVYCNDNDSLFNKLA
jgi:hypothetical protein